ncbi:MAG: response regulator transcription factor, partial [Patescibacteria group bacterium]|nr:response regulator transcription factor [Patescibacteria group bacterium]
LQLCRTIRSVSLGRYVYTMLLTANSERNQLLEGLAAGADDYLPKPFAFAELLARIKALTRRPPQTIHPILQIGDLTLDTNTRHAQRAGKTISLSSREYAILEYLLRHNNQILSKEQIMNHVWPYDADVLPNSVEVYISHLRKKIDTPPHKPLIHTIKGFGYKISEHS